MTVKMVVLMAGTLSSKILIITLEPVSVPVLSLQVALLGTSYIAPDIRA
jgi:hypothetical protein